MQIQLTEKNAESVTVFNAEWEIEFPIVDGEIADNFLIVRAGPVRPLSTAESRAFRDAAIGYLGAEK